MVSEDGRQHWDTSLGDGGDRYPPRPAESWHRGSWMETFTGKKFYPMAPRAEDVDPVDIAHALSMLCRYNGHVRKFYSVAEHCVLMSGTFGLRTNALWALLHDATEAYVGDMIRPLKQHMPDYVRAESGIMRAIAERFDLEHEVIVNGLGQVVRFYGEPQAVKDADRRILLTERRALMPVTGNAWTVDDLEPLDVQIHGWEPTEAKYRYLTALRSLGVDIDG